MRTNISNQQFTDSVGTKVDALPNLTPEQREIVREIAVAATPINGFYSRLDPCEVFRDRQITAHQLLQRS